MGLPSPLQQRPAQKQHGLVSNTQCLTGLLLQKRASKPSWRTQGLSLAVTPKPSSAERAVSPRPGGGRKGGIHSSPSPPYEQLRSCMVQITSWGFSLHEPPMEMGSTSTRQAPEICAKKSSGNSAYNSTISEPLHHREAMARTDSVPARHSITATPDSALKEYLRWL